MKRNLKSIRHSLITALAIGLLHSMGLAQQEPTHAMYMMNKLLVNPAYAGYKENANFTLVHRSQWLGFKGAPSTQVLSFDTPMKKDKLAFGATIYRDKIGPTSFTGAEVNFTYRMRLTNRATFAFGLKASAALYQANLTDLFLISDYYGQEDVMFQYNVNGLLLPNAGFGMFYYKKDHYIGFSVPKMIRNRLDPSNSPVYDMMRGRQEWTSYLTAGKIIKVNKQIKLQPNMIIKGQINAPLSAGMYFNVIFLDQFTAGLFAHYKEAAGLLVQWQLDKQFKFGYSFDVPTSALIKSTWGSHELAVSYSIPTKRKRIVYPRYF